MMERGKELFEFCAENDVGITSFNLLEIDYNLKHMSHEIKVHWRNFLKEKNFSILELSVHPGDREAEKNYIKDFDNDLLQIIPDPSDAVLLVAGLRSRANILTRDKHHLFTTKLQNYLNGYEIQVFNNLPK